MVCILVVDDEKDTTELLGMCLAGEGFRVLELTSGAFAVELAREHRPDLIILDLMMPEVSGLDVCRSIRSQRETADIPILMLSALGDEDYKALAYNAGADDYLAKPVQYAELKSHLQALLKRRAPVEAAGIKPAKVIAILGAAGGVGASTAALNLAAAWVENHPRTALVELRPGAGSLVAQLGLSPSQTLGDLLSPDEDQLDEEKMRRQIRKTIIQGPAGLDLLPSEQDARLAMRFQASSAGIFETIIKNLAEMYDYVFVDLGHGYTTVTAAICALADRVCIVARAQPFSIQSAVQQIRLMETSGLPRERIHTILSAFQKSPYALGPEQARQVFRQQDYPYNVLLGFPPMAELLHQSQEDNQPVIALEPQGARIKAYLQESLEKVLD